MVNKQSSATLCSLVRRPLTSLVTEQAAAKKRQKCRCPLWVKSRHWSRSASCPLYPQKRTLAECSTMSAKCQKRTFALASLNHFVGGRNERRRNGQAERFRGLDVDDKVELGRVLDRDVGGLRPSQNFVDHVGSPPEQIGVVRSIGHETTGFDIIAIA